VVEHKLLGMIPLDVNDEGLDPVGVGDAVGGGILRFFDELVQEREVAKARVILEKKKARE
jgi:hypothetical protein